MVYKRAMWVPACTHRLPWRGAASWQEYSKLFVESRFVHVTSTDFAALCTICAILDVERCREARLGGQASRLS